MRTYLTKRIYCLLLTGGLITSAVGCQTYGPTNLTPAKDVLNASCCRPDTETEINFLALRQTPPEQYVLDKGDILGIYIQGITGDKDVPPPVNFPSGRDEDLDPGLGYPVPVRDDGYISLPLVTPIRVTGLTLSQAERKIVGAYTKDKKILLEGNEKIIVTLMKRRTYNVLVIREDGSDTKQTALRRGETFLEDEIRSESFSIELPAYENDVLHALSETGGLPGQRALNEIVVLRGGQNQGTNGSFIQAVGAPNFGGMATTIDGANAIRIPIRGEAGSFPNISEQDITLNDGDIVYIKGREREVFYTGGLLPGSRVPLPRDYDIDVMEAIALAGGSGTSSGAAGGSIRLGQVKPATQVTILRKCGCEQVAIAVDLRYTLSDPSERVIIQPGDLIVLEYRQNELFINTAAQVLTFGGIFNLFR